MSTASDSIKATLRRIIDHLEYIDVFAELLVHYMAQKGISQATLSLTVGMAPSTVSNWASGVRLPENSGLVYRIGKALNLTAEQLDNLIKAYVVQRQVVDLISFLKMALQYGTEEECELARALVFELLKVKASSDDLPDDHLADMIGVPR